MSELQRVSRCRIERSLHDAKGFELVAGGLPTSDAHLADLFVFSGVAGNKPSVAESLSRISLLRRIQRRIKFEQQSVGGTGIAKILLPAAYAGADKFRHNVWMLARQNRGS